MTTHDKHHSDKAKNNPPPRWGARLKEAREALHLSEKDAAMRLHLKSHIISLMETEDFEHAPPAIFMRGYIRSYGRLLNFSEKEIDLALVQLALENPNMKASPSTLRPRTTQQVVTQGGNYTGWTTSLILLTLIALVGMWWNNHAKTNLNDIGKSVAQQNITPAPEQQAPLVAETPAVPAEPITPPPTIASPSDPIPQELAPKQAAGAQTTQSSEQPPAVAAENLPSKPDVIPQPTQALTAPAIQPDPLPKVDANNQNPPAVTTDGLPNDLSEQAISNESKKARVARTRRNSDQDMALPEADLDGEDGLENSGDVY